MPLTYRRVRAGPWRGMRDPQQPSAAGPDFAALLQNCFPVDTAVGPRVTGRPGFSAMGAQLGSAGGRTVQRFHQFTKTDATETTVGVCGGYVYTYDWGGDSWTEVLNPTDLTGASITLSASAKVYAVTFNNGVVFSDGTNTAFSWDGTAHGGLTKLTNAPVFYGQPWVYYNKLFGIKNTARGTLVWSEEAAVNTGYEAGGYNNAWDLRQTSQEPLVAGVGLNDVMYLFRPNSITYILGAVTTDFSSTGTLEGVSGSEGTSSPAGVVRADAEVYFLSSSRRLYRITAGGSLVEVAAGVRQTVSTVARGAVGAAVAAYRTELQHVYFGLAESGQTVPSTVVAVDRPTGECAGIMRWGVFNALDEVKNSAGVPTLVHGGGGSATVTAEGRAYHHGFLDGAVWSDGFTGGTAAVAHQVRTGPLAYDEVVEKHFERLDVSAVLNTDLTLTVTYAVPRGTGTTQQLTFPDTAGGRWDADEWDDFVWAGAGGEQRAALGLEAEGRWCDVTLSHASTTERLDVVQLSLSVAAVDDGPDTY